MARHAGERASAGLGGRPRQGRTGRRAQRGALILLGLVILFHLVNNSLWLARNEVVYGFDRMTHQLISLEYDDILSEGLGPRTLFAALTRSGYYPPLVHLTAVGFYRLLGVSMDAAALSNSVYLVLFLLAVYGLGERFGGPWVGLNSAAIASTFPIIFSMSRYLYVDFALTSLVAVNVCLLVRANRFRHRAYTLLYGLSLGLGMLTKWTFAAFAAPPLLVVLASSGALPAAWRALLPPAWDGRRLLVANLLGLGLTAGWFLPNLAPVGDLPLGYVLPVLSWLFWSATFYFCLMAWAAGGPAEREDPTPTQGYHLLAALLLGLSVAGSWYLTRIDFLYSFWLNAYGKPTGRSWGFGRYLDFLVREQISPLYVVPLLLAVLGLIVARWRRTRASSKPARELFNLGAEGWAIVLWVAVSFVIFSSRVSIVHSRYIMPLLPPLAIALALGLARLRPPPLRGLVTGLLLAAALVQVAALSFDRVAGLREAIPFLANGLSIQLPASGRTDPGYWVVPDILDFVDEHRDQDHVDLGLLVSQPQVHRMHFAYLAETQHPHIQIKGLVTIGWENPAYPRLYECDFVLLIEPPPSYPRYPDTVATLERLLTEPDDSFHRAFDLAETYSLPDGHSLLLYARRFGPPPDEDLAYYETLVADLSASAQAGDALILVPPELVYAMGRYGDGSLPLYPLPATPRPLAAEDGQLLAQIGAGHSRVWAILGDLGRADPTGLVTGWLAERFYPVNHAWYGPVQRLLCAPEAEEAGSLQAGQAAWQPREAGEQESIALRRYRLLDPSLSLGGILRLELEWLPAGPVGERYKVFLQLLNDRGELVAQRDSEPAAGTRPTTTWQPGESIADRHGLLLPWDLPPGDYRLIVGLYHPDTGERLPACCPAGDAVPLAQIRVEDGTARILALHGN
jgi:4-amino-4-deoxy-L-arabinose transferase-like glycosyltransferase